MSRLHRQTHNRTWARIRREVLDRDGWRCQTEGCGKPGRLEVHHVKHLQEGGTNDLGNLTGPLPRMSYRGSPAPVSGTRGGCVAGVRRRVA